MSDQENKIKCPVCGAECPSEAKFCRKCGVSLNTAETAREPSGIKEGAENNDSPSGQKSGSAPGVTIPLPAVIAGGALIIVLAALILRFTVFQKAGDGENRQDDSVSETAAREGETSFEEVDIDAVHNSVNEISGKITNEGPVLVIDLPEPESVYIYDPGEMREALIRDVSRIYIDEGTSIDLDTYFGAEVTVAGTLAMAGQDISISVTEITASNIETDFNEAFGISETTVEDYGVNLDPGQYGHYDS